MVQLFAAPFSFFKLEQDEKRRKDNKMLKFKPKCLGKCDNCFFHLINGCVALGGEDHFLPINEKQAKLIVANKDRFNVSASNIQWIMCHFPELSTSK